MKIEIPDDIVYRAEASALELRVALAVQLYSDIRIDHRDACRLAGVSETMFNRELLGRHISLQQYPAKRTAG